MTEIEKLEAELKKAKAEEVNAYGQYMYYECADRGYDFNGSDIARKEWLNASHKVSELEKQLNELKGK